MVTWDTSVGHPSPPQHPTTTRAADGDEDSPGPPTHRSSDHPLSRDPSRVASREDSGPAVRVPTDRDPPAHPGLLPARSHAQQELQETVSRSLQHLAESLGYCHDTCASQWYCQQHDSLAAMEVSLIQCIQENHDRRRALVRTMDQTQRAMTQKCTWLAARVVQADPPGDGSTTNDQEPSHEANHKAMDAVETTSVEDIDWNDIAELYEPSVVTIHTFLDGRVKLQESEVKFHASMEQFEKDTQELLEKLQSVAHNAYSAMDEPLDGLQLEIQDLMNKNSERRERYEELIRHRAQAAQNLFTRLMTRTMGGVRRSVMNGFRLPQPNNQKKHKTQKD